MSDQQSLIAFLDIATDRVEFAVGWEQVSYCRRGRLTPVVLRDEIDAYRLADVALWLMRAAQSMAVTQSDAGLGRRAACRQHGRARVARRGAVACL